MSASAPAPFSVPVAAWVGLGSNLADPEQQLNTALKALQRLSGCRVRRVSPSYWNPSLLAEQPDYLNAVVVLLTRLSAVELLHALHAQEQQQGRQRQAEQWAPRSLDLDLLLYGDEAIDTAELTVPHPRMAERRFVIQPLADLAPALMLPNGQTAQEQLAVCPNHSMRPGPILTHADASPAV